MKRPLPAILLTIFIDLVGFSIIFPLFPAMLQWYLMREGEDSLIGRLVSAIQQFTPGDENIFLTSVLFGGILGSLYSLLQFIAAPIWGRLSDRYGRRKILLWTIGGTALSYALWTFSAGFLLLIISRLLSGMMAGNISVATAAIADNTSKEKRVSGMALVGVAFGLGFIIGPAIGGFSTLFNLGFHPDEGTFFALNPFSVPAAIALVLSIINWIWVWRAFPAEPPKEHSEAAQRRFALNSPHPGIRQALRAYFLFITAFSGMEFTLTFLALERLQYQPEDMPKLFIFIGFILAFTQGYLVRKYARKAGERNMVMAGLLCGFLGLLFLANAMTSSLFFIGLGFLGLGIGMSSPALTALISLYAPDSEQGRELGKFRGVGALGRAIGPFFAAIFYWHLGSRPAYFVAACVLLLAVSLAIFLPRPSMQEKAQ